MPTDVRGPNLIVPDSSPLAVAVPASGVQEVCLAGAVGADQPDPLAVVDLVAERQEQIADRHVGELHARAARRRRRAS